MDIEEASMNVLVACETSGEVREAFRALGHNAWSIDLLESDDDSPHHIVGDIMEYIDAREDWGMGLKLDLIIMHPPCTALCVSGNAHYGTGKPKHHLREAAKSYTMKLWKKALSVCDRVAMENPVGVIPMKASQYIQPYEFGHPESKKTGLWLHGLPKLESTNKLSVPESGVWNNQTPSGQNNLGPSADRWKIRSKTYTGIAEAMASQWSSK